MKKLCLTFAALVAILASLNVSADEVTPAVSKSSECSFQLGGLPPTSWLKTLYQTERILSDFDPRGICTVLGNHDVCSEAYRNTLASLSNGTLSLTTTPKAAHAMIQLARLGRKSGVYLFFGGQVAKLFIPLGFALAGAPELGALLYPLPLPILSLTAESSISKEVSLGQYRKRFQRLALTDNTPDRIIQSAWSKSIHIPTRDAAGNPVSLVWKNTSAIQSRFLHSDQVSSRALTQLIEESGHTLPIKSQSLRSLSELQKITVLVGYIESLNNPTLQTAMLTRFQNVITSNGEISLETWLSKVHQSEGSSALVRAALELPFGTPNSVVAELIKNIVFPKMASLKKLPLFSFRNLKKNFLDLEVKLHASDARYSLEIQEELRLYFKSYGFLD